MILTIVSQNVQGLNDPDAFNQTRSYFRPLFLGIDILCLQEHKLRGSRLENLEQHFWLQAGCHRLEALPGYNHKLDDEGAGSGGLCMLINSKIKHLVTSSGNSRSFGPTGFNFQVSLEEIWTSSMFMVHIQLGEDSPLV